jgi:hypothetical protein
LHAAAELFAFFFSALFVATECVDIDQRECLRGLLALLIGGSQCFFCSVQAGSVLCHLRLLRHLFCIQCEDIGLIAFVVGAGNGGLR